MTSVTVASCCCATIDYQNNSNLTTHPHRRGIIRTQELTSVVRSVTFQIPHCQRNSVATVRETLIERLLMTGLVSPTFGEHVSVRKTMHAACRTQCSPIPTMGDFLQTIVVIVVGKNQPQSPLSADRRPIWPVNYQLCKNRPSRWELPLPLKSLSHGFLRSSL